MAKMSLYASFSYILPTFTAPEVLYSQIAILYVIDTKSGTQLQLQLRYRYRVSIQYEPQFQIRYRTGTG